MPYGYGRVGGKYTGGCGGENLKVCSVGPNGQVQGVMLRQSLGVSVVWG